MVRGAALADSPLAPVSAGMTPLLHPWLVNGRLGDPALFVDHRFERRAFLFDLGELHPLGPRKLLRVSDVFVSHMHIDHLIGFDHLLRVLVGRDRRVRLHGPPGFIDAIEHKLSAYSWNLVDRFETDLVFEVSEVHEDGTAEAAAFRLKRRFAREPMSAPEIVGGVLRREEGVEVSFALLDHGVPCLGYAVRERKHVNVWKPRLEALGLAVGPWLRELKTAVREERPDDDPVRALAVGGGERVLPLGRLREEGLTITPGQKIAYVTDVAPHEANAASIAELARGADLLFTEAVFAAADAERARDRDHLTTTRAGELARRAGVRRVEPFHFSPRYQHAEAEMTREVERAFRGFDP